MMEIQIPGYKHLRLSHLVCDYNGTLACDGKLISGVDKRFEVLSQRLAIHVLTADTFGTVEAQLAELPCRISVIPKGDQAQAKLDYIHQLGADSTVCIGNGRNDRLMLERAALGILTLQTEGASVMTLAAADVITLNILDALDLLINPLRLAATLRS